MPVTLRATRPPRSRSEPQRHAPAGVDLRRAFGRAAASTWVVTGSGRPGPVGFTAISVVSVSLEPALVSFNISLVTIAQTQRAALHLLADDQEHLAHRFARDRDRRFADDGAWSYDDHGLPAVLDVAARLVTRIHDLVDAGDSFLALARVEHAVTTSRTPLLHHAGGYLPLTPIGA
jgi:flavin reductase (DIM6/NTAB) family NADH-FMN oxidoreductase RutF